MKAKHMRMSDFDKSITFQVLEEMKRLNVDDWDDDLYQQFEQMFCKGFCFRHDLAESYGKVGG